MSSSSQAPRRPTADGQSQQTSENPFETPTWSPIEHPKPCAYPSHGPRDSAISHISTAPRHEHRQSQPQTLSYKTSSLSSTGSRSMTGGIPSIDLEKIETEKTNTNTRKSSSLRSHNHQSRDPEKAIDPPYRSGSNVSYIDDGDDDTSLQEAKAVRILLFLSGPCVGLSFLNAIWTFISLIITCCTQPVRLCARRPSFGLQLSGLLGPALNLQLKSIYTPLSPHANEDSSYHAWTLVFVHLAAPFLSLGMMVVSWVVAVYWVSSAVVGDPAGMDKQDDGRETVLGLRKWWETFLLRSVKEE